MAKIINDCPVCGKKMKITKLSCSNCSIEVNGEFETSLLSNLSKSEYDFMINFVKSSGNIKEMERIYKLSYPTIKKNLDNLIKKLGGKIEDEFDEDLVFEKIKNKEISVDEALKILKKRK